MIKFLKKEGFFNHSNISKKLIKASKNLVSFVREKNIYIKNRVVFWMIVKVLYLKLLSKINLKKIFKLIKYACFD